MNLPSRLGRSFAGVGIVGLVVAGFIQSSTSTSQQAADRAIDLPTVTPIASSDLASEQVDIQKRPSEQNSTQVALEEARVAVELSQAQLAQARINLREFQAKHDTAKILSAQGKVSRERAAAAKAAYNLAQLQHRSASIGLQDSQAQLIAAKAKVSRLECQAHSATEM